MEKISILPCLLAGWFAPLLPLRGADFSATQIGFRDVEGSNGVVAAWFDGASEPGEIEILANGARVAAVAGVPGENYYLIEDLPPGSYTLSAQGGAGLLGSAEQSVTDTPPAALGTPADVVCEAQDNNGTCEISVEWREASPAPTAYQVYLDGKLVLETLPGNPPGATFPASSLGEHCVSVASIVTGLEPTLLGRFRSSPVTSCCDVPCGAVVCPPPEVLQASQVRFGPGPADNAVLARWRLPAPPYANGIAAKLNGQITEQLLGSATSHVFEGLAPSQAYEIAVQGDCGDPAGTSGTLFELVSIVAQTPHVNPTAGPLECAWSAEGGGQTSVRWENAAPSVFIDVYRVAQAEPQFFARIQGTRTSIILHGTAASDEIELQFFGQYDNWTYAAAPIRCQPTSGGSLFVRGICDGQGPRPSITSAIFGLQFLFAGGPTPPCAEACEANGDGRTDIADMIYILNFLFLGGNPPAGWPGVDPTCEEAPADRCAEPNREACAG